VRFARRALGVRFCERDERDLRAAPNKAQQEARRRGAKCTGERKQPVTGVVCVLTGASSATCRGRDTARALNTTAADFRD